MVKIFGMLIPEIWIILILEALFGIGIIVGWLLYIKGRFIAYICESYVGTYKVKKKLRISLSKENFSWGNNAYSVNLSYAIFDNKNKPVLYYLLNKAEPIQPLTGIKIKEDSKTFKIAMDGKIMQHLANRRVEKMFTYIILGLVFVILVVGVYSLWSMQQSNHEIVRLADRVLNMTRQSGGIVIP